MNSKAKIIALAALVCTGAVFAVGIKGLDAQANRDPTGAEGVSTPEPAPNPVKDGQNLPKEDSGIDSELSTIPDQGTEEIDPALRTNFDGKWVDGETNNISAGASSEIMPVPAAPFIPTIPITLLFPQNPVDQTTGLRPVTENLGTSIILQGVNRETGQGLRFKVNLGQNINYENLTIHLNACYRAASEEQDESWAHVEIVDRGQVQGPQLAFLPHRNRNRLKQANSAKVVKNGWIISSSPSVTPIDHPIYDLYLVSCDGGAAVRTIVAQSVPNTGKKPVSKKTGDTNETPAPVAIAPTAPSNPAPETDTKTK